ncbi:hypothetical protein AB0H34_10350 [Saccharopolyspora shandongensis]|uniref:hypothetical protein n=1 Tax=Saccharopolyspora shandongensis TaxID=418495 RepID=UPI003409AC7D
MNVADPVELLANLVRIPSINPRERAEPAETELAENIAQWASERGMQARTEEVLDGRRNVIVTLPGDDDRPLMLESHLDTAETDGMTIDPFVRALIPEPPRARTDHRPGRSSRRW